MGRVFSSDVVVVASPAQISADLAGEVAVLHLKSGIYYGLDAVGARIWSLLREPQTVGHIQSTLVSEYDVDPDQCAADVIALLEKLSAEGLIELTDG